MASDPSNYHVDYSNTLLSLSSSPELHWSVVDFAHLDLKIYGEIVV